METPLSPTDIQAVERTFAIRWSDGREDYFDMELLRAISPSAENLGEADFFGNIRGGDPRVDYPGVRIVHWEKVGNYALRLFFNDGHSSGFYTFRYLRLIADKERQGWSFPMSIQKELRPCSDTHGHHHHHHGHDEGDE
jgi:DUF971 family protein